jgi:hypothetical protein
MYFHLHTPALTFVVLYFPAGCLFNSCDFHNEQLALP